MNLSKKIGEFTMRKMKSKYIIFLILCTFVITQAFYALPIRASESIYVVKKGDNLWSIAQEHSMTIAELKGINNLSTDVIHPNQQLTLVIPTSSENYYLVQPGDSLWKISQRSGTSINTLRALNAITGDVIYPNQRILLPSRDSFSYHSVVARPVSTAMTQTQNYTEKDLYWLARAISSEARGEPLIGQIGVGAVILNRMTDAQFPNNVYSVIFQKVKGVYQFSPVANGSIYTRPTEQAIKAARMALEGTDPTNGALYFFNPALTSRSNWIRTRPVATVVNNHVFTL